MTAPVIAFRGVGLSFPGPPKVDALKPSDVQIRAGEYVTIVGPSGSGKSTFMNVAGLLHRPTRGTYELEGVDTGTLNDKQISSLRGRRIGFVFQAFNLLPHRTAIENVALAELYAGVTRKQRIAAAAEALVQVDLAHRLHANPSTLSGGERQRVAVARALVHRPSLLLCDEPTGNLDSQMTGHLLDLLSGLHANGMTIVVITHDPVVAMRGQRRLSIHDGTLVGE